MLTVLTQKPLFSTGKLSDAHHLATCSRGRSAARRATNSLYRSAAPITAQSIRAGDERAWRQTAGVDPLKAARKLWKHTRVNEGRIRLKPTIRAVDADILGSWTARRPSKVDLIIDTPRWSAISHDWRRYQLFHMTGGVSRITICQAE